MRNTINNMISGNFNLNSIDELLPFTNKVILLWHISRMQVGYGRWRVSLEMEVDGAGLVLRTTTTDSMLIDDLVDDLDAAKQKVIEVILAANEDKLEELA